MNWNDFFLKCDKTRTFCPNSYKDFQFPVFPGKDFLLLLRIPWFYFENFKKGGEGTSWMSTKVVSLSVDTPQACCLFNRGGQRKVRAAGGQCAGPMAFLATVPASFPPLPLSCPKVSVGWRRQRQHLPPPGTGPLSLVVPQPPRSRGAMLSLSATNRVTSPPGSLLSAAVQSEEEIQSCWVMMGVGN